MQDQQNTSASGSIRPMTYGEKAVGLTFNPSGNETVNQIKMLYASIIDELCLLKTEERNEKNRLISIAITEAQIAQMWAVKAVTWNE